MFTSIEEMQIHLDTLKKKDLQFAVIYFISPITNKVEERHIYADDIVELYAWSRDLAEFYTSLTVDFIGYINDTLEYSNGLSRIFQQIDNMSKEKRNEY